MRRLDLSHKDEIIASQHTKERDYWLKKLSGPLEKTSFPYDHNKANRGAGESQVRAEEFELGGELFSRLLFISNKSDSRLYMILTAGLVVLLSKYTDRSDIIIGTPTIKQTVEAKFINTVMILRNQLQTIKTFKDLLKQVRETLVEAAEHVNYPLETLLYKLNLPVSQDSFPLFDVAILLKNIHDRRYLHQIRLNMIFSFCRQEHRITGELKYNSSLYEKSTVQGITTHLVHMLERLAFNVDVPLSEIDVLSEEEKHRLIYEFNGIEKDIPAGKTLHGLFEEQAEKTGDKIAQISRGARPMANGRTDETPISITYRELNEYSNQLAWQLKEKGVKPGAIAALMMEPSIEMVAAILAVLKGGGAYLPIDPGYPEERKHYMVNDSRARVLVTTRNLAQEVGKLRNREDEKKEIICLDGCKRPGPGEAFSEKRHAPCSMPHANHASVSLAYVIYTSGTTGRPKGTAVEHRGVVNMLLCRKDLYRMGGKDVALNLFSYSFDGFITSCFTPLVSGAAVVLFSESGVKDITEITTVVKAHRVTHMICVPQLFKTIVQYMTPGELSTLKVATLAGDSIPAGLLDAAREKNKAMEIVNEYGVTEGSVMSTIYRHQEREERISIGRPIWNTRIYILSKRGALQPVGVPGELSISGVCLARGYLNNPELTNEKFDQDFQDYQDDQDEKKQGIDKNPSTSLYRTGDRARWLPDGNIEFLGRMDQQVKVRGFRIEPGEIENRLVTHPRIKESVVIARKNKHRDRYLCAYYVEDENQPPELWPSVAEFFVYDELLYYAMTHDERRNQHYKAAVNQLVKDKVVVEVGTGQDAILTKFCVEAGARKVYAIELMESSYEKARESIRQAGLEDRVHLVHGDATRVELPEKADVCVSEIVGSIGGSEGAAVILNNARRFLKESGIMIPLKSVTKIAAVSLPDALHVNPQFTRIPADYTQKIFRHLGYPFDLRICIKNLPGTAVISNDDVFENLDFTAPVPEEAVNPINLVINRNTRLDGFLLWLNLHTIEGEVIDILEHEYCWLPVFVPLFYPGIDVSADDRIQGECIRTLCENKVNPDFSIKGVLKRDGHEDVVFEYDLPHFEKRYKSHSFYQKLFNAESTGVPTFDSDTPLNPRALSEYLGEELPVFMIPTHFIPMDRIPLTTNGKVDRQALPEPDEGLTGDDYTPPRDEVEKNLVEIWQDVLGIEKIGITDNFFMIGGDSIKAIQIAARLKKYQMDLKIDDLFLNPTIMELAAHVKKTKGIAHQGTIEGDIPLTPIQHWFFQKNFTNKNHLNHSVILYNKNGFEENFIETIFEKLVQHHDVLRMVYTIEDEKMVQRNRGMEGKLFDFEIFNFEDKSNIETRIEKEADRIQQSIDLEKGPLVKVGLFKTADGNHLLIVIHHLVVDGVSWRILLEDFSTAYCQLEKGEEIQLPTKTESFKHWSEALSRYASTMVGEESREFRQQLEYWKEIETTPVDPLPQDREVTADKKKTKYAKTVSLELNREETETLLKKVNYAYNTEINDILLTTLGLALKDWSGHQKVLINLEGHGRGSIINGVDISRTVGWFTSQFPLLLDMGKFDHLPEQIIHVKETLRQVPNKGIGYGILRYLVPEKAREGVYFSHQPEVCFNYLGQFLQETLHKNNGGVFSVSRMKMGNLISPESEMIYVLDVRGMIVEGKLKLSFVYNGYQYRSAVIEDLRDGCKQYLMDIIDHCTKKEVTQQTVSDFTASDFDEQEMEDLFDELENV
jgi:amino acid adenylation domain-containing protein/non-ribosomal peptide synthase protein (TIGR01720 family)